MIMKGVGIGIVGCLLVVYRISYKGFLVVALAWKKF